MRFRSVFVLVACMQFAAEARSEEAVQAAPTFYFGAFGTLGLAYADERHADFSSSLLKPNGAGYSHRLSTDVDTRVGAQVTANFTPELSGVVQVLAQQRYNNTYNPVLEWANLKYKFSPDFSVRIGRIALPTFLAADYRWVGYAIPWVRTPDEVYGIVPVTNSDGIDAAYRIHVQDWTNTLRVFQGRTDVKATSFTAKARNAWGATNTVDYGAARFRVAYLASDVSIDSLSPLFDGFRQFGPEGQALADKYDSNPKRFTFVSLGASYEPEKGFLMGEWGRNKANSFIGDKTAWYVSGGYRIGQFTPYLMYAEVRSNKPTAEPGLSLSGLSPEQAALAAGLNAKLNALVSLVPVQKTITVGVRWDVMKNAAAKLQYDRIRHGAGSPGTAVNIQPGFVPGGTVNVVSAVLDFAF